MLYALSGRTPPDPVVQVFYSHTEGNPFFIEELFLHLVERGKLTDANGDFRKHSQRCRHRCTAERAPGHWAATGATKRRDPEDTRIAAVIGRSFTFELLEASTAAECGRAAGLYR